MSTPNMLLELPTVTVTVGPDWANELNAALEVVDAHDHTSGKGARITPAALEINTDLDIANNIFFNFQAVRFQPRSTSLSGAANANSLQSVSGNLFFTSGAGTPVQLTDGGSIVSSPGSASIFESILVNTDVTINNSDTFVYLITDTISNPRTITLPLASGVAAGRIYIIKDSQGNTEANSITVATQGSDTIDGASSQELTSNYGSWIIVGDGVSSWFIS